MKTLIALLGWIPVLGQALKLSYVAKCANDSLSSLKVSSVEQQEHTANYIEDLSNDLYEQHVRPELDNLGLPSMISNLTKEKALKILSEGIQEKLLTNKS